MEIALSSLGMLRIGVVSPELRVADVDFNLERIKDAVALGQSKGCNFLLFPELCLTGYTCGDLFYQPLLVDQARRALLELAAFTAERQVTVVVGLPVAQDGRLFNCAAFVSEGAICGIVPKTYLPNTQEFYEERWFSSQGKRSKDVIVWDEAEVPFGTDLLFRHRNLPECVVGIEICEDLWVAAPPSGRLCAAGASLVLNLSASPELLGKQEYRRALVASQSARCLAAYAYASAGPGESSTDLVFSGHSLIAEYGSVLAETERFSFATELAVADIDFDRLRNERVKNNSFADAEAGMDFRLVDFATPEVRDQHLCRPLAATPFVPSDAGERAARCREIFALQTTGLAKRLRHTGCRRAVIGVSGGLDSTLALLVTVKAFDKLGLERSGIEAVTMPGFGTTQRTRGNAERLATELGATLRIVPIAEAVRGHFADIGHDEAVHNVTYENAQARERTQILMDIANQIGGLVVGTGDLSELALGWCTYNADHMSMYGVNAGVPKTLVRYLVDWCADEEFQTPISDILHDVSATPVSPELLPPDENGEIGQVTEEHIGPYLLHDFFLYHVVRLQFAPRKIYHLACLAFAGEYTPEVILHWLKNFYRRFFAQQFKRSCLPDGPKIGSVVLSPRGDWRMPSDAVASVWLNDLEGLDV